MKHEQALALSSKLIGPLANFGGHWENELQSTMELTVNGSDVSGTYTSKVSGTGKQIKGKIIGRVTGSVITFFVDWNNGSITSWVGHLVLEGAVQAEWLETLWQLAMADKNPDDPNELWASVFAGSDRFHR